VYLAARSEEKAVHAIRRMEEEGMGERKGELVWLPIDLTDPRKAKAAAEWFVKRESRLDILGMLIGHIDFRIVDRLTFCVISCTVNNAAKCVGSEFSLSVMNPSSILFVPES
jgi:NAD(P)-dependent dehydrogenase (short-subunit alcohol dehydrogenase family)